MNAAQKRDELSELRAEVASLRDQLTELRLVVASIHPELFDVGQQHRSEERPRDRRGLRVINGDSGQD